MLPVLSARQHKVGENYSMTRLSVGSSLFLSCGSPRLVRLLFVVRLRFLSSLRKPSTRSRSLSDISSLPPVTRIGVAQTTVLRRERCSRVVPPRSHRRGARFASRLPSLALPVHQETAPHLMPPQPTPSLRTTLRSVALARVSRTRHRN